jgi:hypothetical protein
METLEAEILQNRLERFCTFLFRFSECWPGIALGGIENRIDFAGTL